MDGIVFNVKEVAEYLHTSENTIRRRVRDMDIPFFRTGNVPKAPIMFRKETIDKWIEDQEQRNSAGVKAQEQK